MVRTYVDRVAVVSVVALSSLAVASSTHHPPHRSLLTSLSSLLFPLSSLLTPHHSPLTSRTSSLTTRSSPLSALLPGQSAARNVRATPDLDLCLTQVAAVIWHRQPARPAIVARWRAPTALRQHLTLVRGQGWLRRGDVHPILAPHLCACYTCIHNACHVPCARSCSCAPFIAWVRLKALPRNQHSSVASTYSCRRRYFSMIGDCFIW